MYLWNILRYVHLGLPTLTRFIIDYHVNKDISHFNYTCEFIHPTIYNTSVVYLGKPIITRGQAYVLGGTCILKILQNRNLLGMGHHSLYEFV